jgi:dolichyl-phosphate beta-glucosyltransferase
MAHHLADLEPGAEIIVVDDGSPDGTAETAREIAPGLPLPVTVVRTRRNRGKGHALKVGFAHAGGERILFTDADLSVPIAAAASLLDELERGADVAIGSRKMTGAEIVVHQPWLRETMGKVFTLLTRAFIVHVSDVTCGFKAFRGDAGRDLFAHLRVSDWSFDAELLFLARRRGLTIREVPVQWHDEPDTKVRLALDALHSLIGLVRIRWNSAVGAYRRPAELEPGDEVWTSEGACDPPAVAQGSEGAV